MNERQYIALWDKAIWRRFGAHPVVNTHSGAAALFWQSGWLHEYVITEDAAKAITAELEMTIRSGQTPAVADLHKLIRAHCRRPRRRTVYAVEGNRVVERDPEPHPDRDEALAAARRGIVAARAALDEADRRRAERELHELADHA